MAWNWICCFRLRCESHINQKTHFAPAFRHEWLRIETGYSAVVCWALDFGHNRLLSEIYFVLRLNGKNTTNAHGLRVEQRQTSIFALVASQSAALSFLRVHPSLICSLTMSVLFNFPIWKFDSSLILLVVPFKHTTTYAEAAFFLQLERSHLLKRFRWKMLDLWNFAVQRIIFV